MADHPRNLLVSVRGVMAETVVAPCVALSAQVLSTARVIQAPVAALWAKAE